MSLIEIIKSKMSTDWGIDFTTNSILATFEQYDGAFAVVVAFEKYDDGDASSLRITRSFATTTGPVMTSVDADGPIVLLEAKRQEEDTLSAIESDASLKRSVSDAVGDFQVVWETTEHPETVALIRSVRVGEPEQLTIARIDLNAQKIQILAKSNFEEFRSSAPARRMRGF